MIKYQEPLFVRIRTLEIKMKPNSSNYGTKVMPNGSITENSYQVPNHY